ncbi:MAG: dTDP-4-dehydrorhamnose reductase [Vulcanimicrobiaceae bacterium]
MRVVVIGASGQLGSDLMRAFADLAPIGVDHKAFDIEIPAAIAKLLVAHRPDLVINTAAFHNVELCETRPDRAMAVNALAVDGLAAQCAAANVALAHVSTDYVFAGSARTPYRETDATRPLSAYGISKLAGEHLVWRNLERAYVVRTSGLYGLRGSSTKGYTFIERVLAQAAEGAPIRVVTDVTCTPSYTMHVARAIRRIVDAGRFGTYHVTNAGGCSWYDFATEALRAAGLAREIEPVTAATFASIARRPSYSVLANAAMANAGIEPLPPWQTGVADYLAERATSRS